MKKSFILIFAVLGLFALTVSVHAQTAKSGINTNPAQVQSDIDADQSNRMRHCANKYRKQNIPQDQHAAFISKCMQPPMNKSGPMTPNELAAQNQKNRTCKQNAKTENLTGDKRKAFLQDCLNN